MSTLVEDPGIPLVSANDAFKNYSTDEGLKAETSHKDNHQLSKPNPRSKNKKKCFENVGLRLAKRKQLFVKRRLACDLALGFAIGGIVLAMLENELYMASESQTGYKTGPVSLTIKSFITISTIILVFLVALYHQLDTRLYMVDNSMEDWRLALHSSRILKIIIEMLICCIHPLPGNYDGVRTEIDPVTKMQIHVFVSVDVMFSLPMFLRLYWLCRAIMLHSKLFTDASSQSLGALNRINFNFRFIFKSLMTLYPEYVLTVVIVVLCLLASWALRVCEMPDMVHTNFLNAMWIIAITFLSVGYGDIVPVTHCGRAVAVLTGIFGAGCTALVVAVLTRKLELSRSEKYVHNFVIDVELDKKAKHAAANIVKQGWLIYKHKKYGTGNEKKIRFHQRKLIKSIHMIREVKTQQRRLTDSAVTLVEMARSQINTQGAIEKMVTSNVEIHTRINQMEKSMKLIDNKLNELHRIIKS